MRLSKAQRTALEVLAAYPERWLEGWKRSSMPDAPGEHANGETFTRPARVNMRAAAALARLGLVDVDWGHPSSWSPYTHDQRYRINNKGREALRG